MTSMQHKLQALRQSFVSVYEPRQLYRFLGMRQGNAFQHGNFSGDKREIFCGRCSGPAMSLPGGNYLSREHYTPVCFFRCHGEIMLRTSEKARLLAFLILWVIALCILLGHWAGWW